MALTLEKIPLFQGLSKSELQSVQSCLQEKNYNKGEILLREGECCEHVFFVKTGRIKLFRMASNGREQILESLGPGDTCACNPGLSEWYCSATAEAVMPTEVWFLSREKYSHLVKASSKLAQSLNQLFADRLRRFSALIEEVSLKDVKKRVIKFLLDMLAKKQAEFGKAGGDALYIPYTREEIAQRIGAARESVARQLYQLKKAKLIDIKPHQILILDKEALEKLLS